MKYLTIILSFYIFALSLLPCGDACGGVVKLWDDWLGVEHIAHDDHEQHSNTCNDDPCSPLCGCSCCSIVMDYPMEIAINLVIPPKPSLFLPDNYIGFISLLSTYDIWQPPRLS